MVKFRSHRGSLADSLLTLVEVDDFAGLLEVLNASVLTSPSGLEFGGKVRGELVKVVLYDPLPDNRIGWNETWIVTVANTPVGFTDGEVPG